MNDVQVTNQGGDVINIDRPTSGGDINIKNTESTVITTTTTEYLVKYGDTWTYSGGNKSISSYTEGDKIALQSDYHGIDVRDSSFLVNSGDGALTIENARDKFIGYSTSAETDVVAYSYVASSGGVIDGSDKNVAEIMYGADNADNQILAGSGGSSLWGGNGGADTLVGGDGYDEFIYQAGSGVDVVQNATSNDVINLLGISLEQISNVDVNIGQVNINFVDGGNLTVEGNTGAGFKLGNEVYTVNQNTGEWSTK